MIEINLLPEEIKAAPKKAGKGIELRSLYKFIPLTIGILIFLHICLAAISIIRNYQFTGLNNKWKGLASKREAVNNFKKEYDVVLSNEKAIQQMNARRINWAEKLNKLSLNLPYGIWFAALSIYPENFVLKGSVVSLQKEEVNLINKFIDKLKKDAAFFKEFSSLELSSVQRRVIVSYDVVDFTLTGKLKSLTDTKSIEKKDKTSKGTKSR